MQRVTKKIKTIPEMENLSVCLDFGNLPGTLTKSKRVIDERD